MTVWAIARIFSSERAPITFPRIFRSRGRPDTYNAASISCVCSAGFLDRPLVEADASSGWGVSGLVSVDVAGGSRGAVGWSWTAWGGVVGRLSSFCSVSKYQLVLYVPPFNFWEFFDFPKLGQSKLDFLFPVSSGIPQVTWPQ